MIKVFKVPALTWRYGEGEREKKRARTRHRHKIQSRKAIGGEMKREQVITTESRL